MMNMRLAQPDHLIDINRIARLDSCRAGRQIASSIGALVRHARCSRAIRLVRASCPMLAHAAGTIGHYAIRQRGTIGGSLAHADPAAQLPLVAIALDAEIELALRRGPPHVPATGVLSLDLHDRARAGRTAATAVPFPVSADAKAGAFACSPAGPATSRIAAGRRTHLARGRWNASPG